MDHHEYALNGTTQQDSTIQCGPLATAGQNTPRLWVLGGRVIPR